GIHPRSEEPAEPPPCMTRRLGHVAVRRSCGLCVRLDRRRGLRGLVDRALSLSGLTVTTPRRVLGCYGGPVGGLEVCVILDSSRLIELGVLNGRLRRRDILVPDRGWL